MWCLPAFASAAKPAAAKRTCVAAASPALLSAGSLLQPWSSLVTSFTRTKATKPYPPLLLPAASLLSVEQQQQQQRELLQQLQQQRYASPPQEEELLQFEQEFAPASRHRRVSAVRSAVLREEEKEVTAAADAEENAAAAAAAVGGVFSRGGRRFAGDVASRTGSVSAAVDSSSSSASSWWSGHEVLIDSCRSSSNSAAAAVATGRTETVGEPIDVNADESAGEVIAAARGEAADHAAAGAGSEREKQEGTTKRKAAGRRIFSSWNLLRFPTPFYEPASPAFAATFYRDGTKPRFSRSLASSLAKGKRRTSTSSSPPSRLVSAVEGTTDLSTDAAVEPSARSNTATPGSETAETATQESEAEDDVDVAHTEEASQRREEEIHEEQRLLLLHQLHTGTLPEFGPVVLRGPEGAAWPGRKAASKRRRLNMLQMHIQNLH